MFGRVDVAVSGLKVTEERLATLLSTFETTGSSGEDAKGEGMTRDRR